MLLFITIASSAALAAVGDKFDASSQFRDTYDHGTTPWNYGHATSFDGDIAVPTKCVRSALPCYSWDGSPDFPIAIYNDTAAPVTVASGLEMQPGILLLHPAISDHMSVLAFEAPYSACYQADLAVILLDSDNGSVDVTLYANAETLSSNNLSGAGDAAKANTDSLFLSAGETVALYVGDGENGSIANDALEATLTLTVVSEGVDTDGDGTLDACPGDCDNDGIIDQADADKDEDGDGKCDHPCEHDADVDLVCDDVDECQGDNSTGDEDDDGVCDDLDECEGDDSTGDHDADGLCADREAPPATLCGEGGAMGALLPVWLFGFAAARGSRRRAARRS